MNPTGNRFGDEANFATNNVFMTIILQSLMISPALAISSKTSHQWHHVQNLSRFRLQTKDASLHAGRDLKIIVVCVFRLNQSWRQSSRRRGAKRLSGGAKVSN